MSPTAAKTDKTVAALKQHQKAIVQKLRNIQVAASKYHEPYVEPATIEAWQIHVDAMPLEPRECKPDMQFFLPLPKDKLREAYNQRLRDCEDIGAWPFPIDPCWAGSDAVPDMLLHWLLQVLGPGHYDHNGLCRFGDWEWLRYVRAVGESKGISVCFTSDAKTR
jgi:hypothetical protein